MDDEAGARSLTEPSDEDRMYPFGGMEKTAGGLLEKEGVQRPARMEGHDPSLTANLEKVKVEDGRELKEKQGRCSPDSFVEIGAGEAATSWKSMLCVATHCDLASQSRAAPGRPTGTQCRRRAGEVVCMDVSCRLPTFEDPTVDRRPKEFRWFSCDPPRIESVLFDSSRSRWC